MDDSQSPHNPDNPEIIIGLTAAVGTPLELFENLLGEELKRYGYESETLRLSKYTERFDLTKPFPAEGDREANRIEAMMTLGNEARSVTGRNDILSVCAISDIRVKRGEGMKALPEKSFILRQLKHPDEVYTLRRTYGDGFLLMGLYCPREARENHLRERGANADEVRRLIDRDEYESLDWGQHLRDTFHMSDVFLELGKAHETIRTDLARFLRLLFGEGVIAPNKAEYGMFQAFAASLRSAQMGRQVGAAILSPDGDLVSVGTNEVPKFGGGLYWEDDENDRRDHVRKRDSSDEAKEEVVREILERTYDSWESQTSEEKQRLIADYSERLRSTRITALTEFGRAVHAESEAILSAARMGVSPKSGTLYCTTFPCHVCARHIVAAGITRVLYIEPYPKSRASELHNDSISLEEAALDKVQFKPFVGVAPRVFSNLFSMVSDEGFQLRRKDEHGNVNAERTGLRLSLPYFSALDREKLIAKELEEELSKDKEGIRG